MILVYACIRIAYESNKLVAQITLSIYIIYYYIFKRIVKKRVNCKIAPKSIFFCVRKNNCVRTTSVAVACVGSESCNFKIVAIFYSQYDSEFFSDWDCVFKQFFNFI